MNFFVRSTFFAHFCAGEDEASMRPTIAKLASNSVDGIFDYAAEGDIATSPAAEHLHPGAVLYEKNTQIFLSCVESVANTSPKGFAAIKITALSDPELLEAISHQISDHRALFTKLANVDGLITEQEFLEGFPSGEKAKLQQLWEAHFKPVCSTKFPKPALDFIDWTDGNVIQKAWESGLYCGGPTQEQVALWKAVMDRFRRIAELAKSKQVLITVDAEQTYFQRAIDLLVQVSQSEYNKDGYKIYHTYQGYLKDSYKRARDDLERSKRQNYHFAAKVVRGAYMHTERERAKELGLPDPIHNSLEDTHASYHSIIDMALENIKTSSILVATHNEKSVEHTITKMQQMNIDPKTGGVYFAQLMGMSDFITFSLGRNGYNAYKYVPFGPVHEVIPYLLRRARENSTMLDSVGAEKERGMLAREIVRRITFGFV